MSNSIAALTHNPSAEELYPALTNPAVAHCLAVHNRTYELELRKKKGEVMARVNAATAYRLAMPPLSGYRNACDFIACVGYGMLSHIILMDSGTKFLYAAQVALSSVAKPSIKPDPKPQEPRTPLPPPPTSAENKALNATP
jgi:hypothetical protein